jgi:hypothetical protein
MKKILDTDAEYEVEVQDGIIPTVKEVKATGEKNIRITFSSLFMIRVMIIQLLQLTLPLKAEQIHIMFQMQL